MSSINTVSRRRALLVFPIAISMILLLTLPGFSLAAGEGGPEPPAGLEVFQREEDLGLRVTLTWNHRPDCAGYRVYRSEGADGSYTFVGGVSAGTASEFPFFLDDTAACGRTYYYRVTALDQKWREGPQGPTVKAVTERYMRTSAVGKSIIVSLADQRAYFSENGIIVNILRCSTGASGTPTGNYRILAHRGTVSGCNYWMDWRPNYGMHAWPSYLGEYEENLGVTPRSHGCIRLHPLEASWPYYWAPDGTPFTIIPNSYSRLPFAGSSCSSGATKPSKTWYFAEGYTGGEFRDYLTFFNPGSSDVNALTTYYPEGASPVSENYRIAAGGRFTVFVNGVAGLAPNGHATKIAADGEIVAQQTEYFDYGGRRGGHSSLGASSPSKEWFFAEGDTTGSSDTYLLLFNPNEKASPTIVTYFTGNASVTQRFDVPPLFRGTILVNAVVPNQPVAMAVASELPLVAQRTVYFSMGIPNGINGGDCSMGIDRPSKIWYLAEGATQGFFDEYVMVLNPGGETANVTAGFYPETGPYGFGFQVAPYSRATIHVDSIPALASVNTAAEFSSNREIVVECKMYINRDSRRGGHVSNGITTPSTVWYFSEGYTGGTFDEYLLLFNP
ncbi:MAG: L,D-transpeptidase family protein, partial [Actinobacteria bacterium]|nr:L,D-transpeptidase family protein [Actinomycetota bacterium]